MKRFIAIAATITCCMGNEMPANASMSTKKMEQAQTMLQKSLDAAKKSDWKTACTRYKEYAEFKKTNKGFEYDTVVGTTGKVRELTIQLNKKIKQSNEYLNKNGSRICKIANMSWTNYVMPAAPASAFGSANSASSVAGNIRSRCERKWGTDYEMVRYCIDRQSEAARSLGY